MYSTIIAADTSTRFGPRPSTPALRLALATLADSVVRLRAAEAAYRVAVDEHRAGQAKADEAVAQGYTLVTPSVVGLALAKAELDEAKAAWENAELQVWAAADERDRAVATAKAAIAHSLGTSLRRAVSQRRGRVAAVALGFDLGEDAPGHVPSLRLRGDRGLAMLAAYGQA